MTWPKKSSFLSKSKKKAKNVNYEDIEGRDETGKDKKNKLDFALMKSQETQTYPVQSVTVDEPTPPPPPPPKQKSRRYRCCCRKHRARDSGSQQENDSIWSCIWSCLPDFCCFKTSKDDSKGGAKHCSDKGLPGSKCKDPEPDNKGKTSEGKIEQVRNSTTVMPLLLVDDATKPSDDKPCPCKGRPVWSEFLKPPKPKKRCRHCHKLT